MQELNSEESVRKMSKINSAGLINLRLHILWLRLNDIVMKDNFSAWNKYLDRIYSELAADVKKGSIDETGFTEVNRKVSLVGPLLNWGGRSDGFKKLVSEGSTKKGQQYAALMAKEIYIRQLQTNQGKGTAYEEDIDDYMD